MINKEYIEIQELVEAIIDNRGKTVPTSENGIPLIATNCIKHSSIFPTFENIRYINQETYDNWFRAHLKPNDILFVNKGTPGRCCIIPNPVNFVAAQDMVGLRFKKHLNPYYMLAVLRSKEIQNTIENNHVGLVIAHFRKQELVKLKLPILEETIRNKIGDFYEIISKKIELNNRINAELEAMAKTLYDYWFVQFDFPVASTGSATTTGSATEISGENVASTPLSQQSDEKNKAAERSQETVAERSRGYKSSGGKMVYNETLKREIPEGWEIKTVGELVNIFDSKRIPLSKSEREKKKGIFPYYGATEIMDYINDFIFDGEYILLAEDGSVMNSEGFPILQYIYGKTWVNNHAHVLQSKQIEYTEYLYKLLEMIPVILIKSGSIQMKINQDNLLNYKLLVAPETLILKYSKFAKIIRQKLIQNQKQNQELSALRDWLLPMLMNGQVKVG